MWKLPSTCPWDYFEENVFLTKNLCFIIFAQRANSSGVLLELFRLCSEKCIIGADKNVFLGAEVCGKSISSLTVFRPCAKTVGPSDKVLRQGCVWISFYVSLTAFSEVFSLKLNLFSSNCFIERNFFCRNFSGGIEKSGFQVSAGNVWWQGLRWKIFRQHCETCILRVNRDI